MKIDWKLAIAVMVGGLMLIIVQNYVLPQVGLFDGFESDTFY